MFQLGYIKGDLTTLPPEGSIIVHTCNCFGQLGTGVALAMKNAFPAAHDIYAEKCKAKEYREELRGECFLIPPQIDGKATESGEASRNCWIGCLLTSHGYGSRAVKSGKTPHPKKDDSEQITTSTKRALESLRSEMEENFANRGDKHLEVSSSKMNAGNFGVEWEETEGLIKDVFEGMDVKWTVVVFES